MKFYFYISLLFFGVISSCGSDKTANASEMMLNRVELIDIIVDIQILESHYHNMYQRPDVYANALDSACMPIFEAHHITKPIFEENLVFQSKNPDTLYVIYEAALDTINNRLNSLNEPE